MTFSLLLGIAGFVATLILGMVSVFIAVRYRHPVQLSYVQDDYIPLYYVVRHQPELEVFFEGESVRENIILAKAFLAHTGRKDITPEMVEQPIRISLPVGFRWHTARVVDSSPGITAELLIEGETDVVLKSGLFRRREVLKIEAIVEVPAQAKEGRFDPVWRLSNGLKISHRIADSGPVRFMEAYWSDINLKPWFWTSVGLVLACLLVTAILLYEPPTDYEFRYRLPSVAGDRAVTIRPVSPGEVEVVSDLPGAPSAIIDIENINASELKVYIQRSPLRTVRKWVLFFGAGIMYGMLLGFVLRAVVLLVKSRRVRHIIRDFDDFR